MKKNSIPWVVIAWLGAGLILLIPAILYHQQIWYFFQKVWVQLSDREAIRGRIEAFHGWAPFAFILFQFLQVLLAPIPGEATGFIGGYLFGAFPGFVYSTIGLTLGSVVNFLIGRFLGNRYIHRWISQKFLDRFEPLLKKQGVLVLLILFIFPGFPKDYLCLFLGLTTLPTAVFLMIATIGRMPGTLMLSLQGAYIYEQLYGMFAVIFGISALAVLLVYRYREEVYRYMERFNKQSPY